MRNADSRVEFKKAFDALIAAGDKNLFYLTGDKLIGDDGEKARLTSSHPTDLGFMRQADAFAESLKPLLEKKKMNASGVTENRMRAAIRFFQRFQLVRFQLHT